MIYSQKNEAYISCEARKMSDEVKIKNVNGKYIIDANIHTEIVTNDIAKVQERFVSDCAYYFAEQIRKSVNTRNTMENF